ncbi:hypothetical protein GCM10027342_20310 [Photobacterium alginatilyticum]
MKLSIDVVELMSSQIAMFNLTSDRSSSFSCLIKLMLLPEGGVIGYINDSNEYLLSIMFYLGLEVSG